jgi:hypothetical protein
MPDRRIGRRRSGKRPRTLPWTVLQYCGTDIELPSTAGMSGLPVAGKRHVAVVAVGQDGPAMKIVLI